MHKCGVYTHKSLSKSPRFSKNPRRSRNFTPFPSHNLQKPNREMALKSPPYGHGTSAAGSGGGAPKFSGTTVAMIARAKQTTQSVIATLRPWRELLDLSSLSLPYSYEEAMARVRHNLGYFRGNYAFAVLAVVFLGLIYHPFSMIAFIVVFVGWILLYSSRDATDPISISGRVVDDWIVLGVLSLVTVLALVYTDVGENVLVSLIVGLVIVGAHAAFRCTDDLFLDEESARQGGLVTAGGRRSTSGYHPI
ncbi:PREDICTED: PRA1 family protein E-like [Tarenaya hassleriana]|uniref:PRA1 family protein E-like n=1 Tax=Tarenaya hassleriana TaxID=28532 RepID=UPI00053C8F0A|nr:PREDICTED: PRA1 family protein E-like [Tarenaya hassleriana]